MVSLDCTNDDDREIFLHGLFPIDADVIKDYDYMIEPISLEAKMRQYNKSQLTGDLAMVNLEVEISKIYFMIEKQ